MFLHHSYLRFSLTPYHLHLQPLTFELHPNKQFDVQLQLRQRRLRNRLDDRTYDASPRQREVQVKSQMKLFLSRPNFSLGLKPTTLGKIFRIFFVILFVTFD